MEKEALGMTDENRELSRYLVVEPTIDKKIIMYFVEELIEHLPIPFLVKMQEKDFLEVDTVPKNEEEAFKLAREFCEKVRLILCAAVKGDGIPKNVFVFAVDIIEE